MNDKLQNTLFEDFPFDRATELTHQLLQSVYGRTQLHPVEELKPSMLGNLSNEGVHWDDFAAMMTGMVGASAGLASPRMMGHMDTAPHPVAAYIDAVVSALNNNLLFRELSPAASLIEEYMLEQIGLRLGLSEKFPGLFCSGGSLANLSALFAATGGFNSPVARNECALFVPACAHASITKAAAVLGIARSQIFAIESDEQGRSLTDSLDVQLSGSHFRCKIVVGILGSTVHGAVENLTLLGNIAERHGAWFHVDAVYGGALAFSQKHRGHLRGIELADSVVVGPQKWMYVPRLSAMLWIKGEQRFNDALEFGLSYSQASSSNALAHRGQWGLQGSRRCDAVTLWLTLSFIGTAALGEQIDASIELANSFYQHLHSDEKLEPCHQPDLNLQCFKFRDDVEAQMLKRRHARLGVAKLPWVSLSSWDSESVFRAVLLAPNTTEVHLRELISAIKAPL